MSPLEVGRRCNQCQLCCKLVPVPLELNKPAGVRCKHQKVNLGCKIYANRPYSCRVWSCRWLADPLTAGMHRPDRSHYVIDLELDGISITQNEGDAPENLIVLQVWVDPAHPHAHRDPALRAYMLRLNLAAIIRYGSTDAFVLFPPTMMAEREWSEQRTTQIVARNAMERMVLAGAKHDRTQAGV